MKRATSISFSTSAKRNYFNPRPREEGDEREDNMIVIGAISIHALVKRATLAQGTKRAVFEHFNPRPREEGDSLPFDVFFYKRYFNPRPREEGDDCFFSSICSAVNFNPRPREEGDAKRDALKEEQEKISIHALVKRATTLRSFVKSLSRISIHALVKRATP